MRDLADVSNRPNNHLKVFLFFLLVVLILKSCVFCNGYFCSAVIIAVVIVVSTIVMVKAAADISFSVTPLLFLF